MRLTDDAAGYPAGVDADTLDRLIARSRRTVIECQLSRVEATRRRDRMLTAKRVRLVLAGPDNLAGPDSTESVRVPTGSRNGFVCALDGDGATMCGEVTSITPVIGYDWRDIPVEQRCSLCQVVLAGFR
jgi:hypothetical protein